MVVFVVPVGTGPVVDIGAMVVTVTGCPVVDTAAVGMAAVVTAPTGLSAVAGLTAVRVVVWAVAAATIWAAAIGNN